MNDEIKARLEQSIVDAVTDHFREPHPLGWEPDLDGVRAAVARRLGVSPDRVSVRWDDDIEAGVRKEVAQ